MQVGSLGWEHPLHKGMATHCSILTWESHGQKSLAGYTLEVKWSEVTQSCLTHQAPQSMEFSRQEYWSGLPFPSPGDLPNPGIKPESPTLQVDALPSEPPGKPGYTLRQLFKKEWAYTFLNGLNTPRPEDDSSPLLVLSLHSITVQPESPSKQSGENGYEVPAGGLWT